MPEDAAVPEKPPTQRQLLESISEGVHSLRADVEKRNAAKRANATARPPYTEADALRDCIDALQRLNNELARPSSGYSAAYSGSSEWDTGARVLRFLADRFHVNLVEIREQPCNRRHLDEVSPDQLLAALNGANPAQRVNW